MRTNKLTPMLIPPHRESNDALVSSMLGNVAGCIEILNSGATEREQIRARSRAVCAMLHERRDVMVSYLSHRYGERNRLYDGYFALIDRAMESGNDEVTQLAKTCVISSPLGLDDRPDLLCVGYYAGVYDHQAEAYAPLELRDIYCRLDRNIADLIQTVEQYVGLENVLFFVTSTGYNDVHQPAVGAFGNERIAVGKALCGTDIGAVLSNHISIGIVKNMVKR